VAKRYGRPEQQRSAVGQPAAQLRMAGWVNSIISAGSATALLAGLALGAVLERAILDSLDNGQQAPDPGDGRIQVRPGGQAPDPARSGDDAAPAAPALSLTSEVEKLTLDQRGQQAEQSYRSRATGKPIVRVSRVDRGRTSALGTSVIPIPRTSSAMPEATLFVAKKSAGRWQTALAGTRSFQQVLQQAPDSLISAGEKQLLTAFSNSGQRSKQAATALSLPWKADEPWTLRSAAGDGRQAAASFVGFSRKGGEVLAAAGGRLYRLCGKTAGRGLVMVIHPNGLATQYYQMSDVTTRQDGSIVQRGDLLGRVGTDRSCGGAAARSPQVLFGVRDGNGAVSLNGKEIGGWRFTESRNALTASRGARRISVGDALPNLGSVPVLPLPGSSESPAPRSGGSSTPASGGES
jgi:murein DD-endopeptidase MepM/ murein hydrolase activator NlpD